MDLHRIVAGRDIEIVKTIGPGARSKGLAVFGSRCDPVRQGGFVGIGGAVVVLVKMRIALDKIGIQIAVGVRLDQQTQVIRAVRMAAQDQTIVGCWLDVECLRIVFVG